MSGHVIDSWTMSLLRPEERILGHTVIPLIGLPFRDVSVCVSDSADKTGDISSTKITADVPSLCWLSGWCFRMTVFGAAHRPISFFSCVVSVIPISVSTC